MEKIKTLSIDLETFSDVDLSKCGVYKYSESPNFEILLFGVSANGGDVEVYDIVNGEKIPEEILAALTDNSVIKWAFNANFERMCLSKYLGLPAGEYLDPQSWRCSMIWAAYMGLPLSLAGTGAVLGLPEQKLKEGKELIKYFCVPCVPTKTNGFRIRNLPKHAPEKWTKFKAYNKRDVEVEMAIQSRLQKFPVPDFVWEEYVLDQQINDRGIALDMAVVENAIAFDERSKSALTLKMQSLTSLENPNSVQQMKQWLSENGLEVDRCVKQTVKEQISTQTHGVNFTCQSGMLFITLPSGRRLSYVKPRIGENKFGGESVTYEGVGATKKWERIESYGPKFVENIIQAISRDILCYAMKTLQNYRICGHVHDEVIIECPLDTSVSEICEMMGRTPHFALDAPVAKGLPLRADGYECGFYKKD